MPRTSAQKRAEMIGNHFREIAEHHNLTEEEQRELIRVNVRISNYGYALHCPHCHQLGMLVQKVRKDGVIYICGRCQTPAKFSPEQIRGQEATV